MGPSPQMFSRPEGVKAYGPTWIGARASSNPVVDPVVFICVLPAEYRLLTVLRSGRLHLHKWFPLKPNGSGGPFTFDPASSPSAVLPEGTVASRACGGPCYAISVDGRWLLSGGHWDCTLRCTCIARPEDVVCARQHCAPICCIDAGADGNTIVTGSSDATVVVWLLYGEAADAGRSTSASDACPRVLHVLSGHRGAVLCAAVSTQLDLILSGAAAERGSGEPSVEEGKSAATGNCLVSCPSKGRVVRALPVWSTPHAVAISQVGNGLVVYSADDADGEVLLLFSINGRPLARTRLQAPVSRVVCTCDGELVVASEGSAIMVRRLHDLLPLHRYQVHKHAKAATRPRISTFSVSSENHHAFAATDDGGMLIYANPLVNIQVLERYVGELLNL